MWFVIIHSQFQRSDRKREAAPGRGALRAHQSGARAPTAQPGQAGQDILYAVGIVGMVEDKMIAMPATQEQPSNGPR